MRWRGASLLAAAVMTTLIGAPQLKRIVGCEPCAANGDIRFSLTRRTAIEHRATRILAQVLLRGLRWPNQSRFPRSSCLSWQQAPARGMRTHALWKGCAVANRGPRFAGLRQGRYRGICLSRWAGLGGRGRSVRTSAFIANDLMFKYPSNRVSGRT